MPGVMKRRKKPALKTTMLKAKARKKKKG